MSKKRKPPPFWLLKKKEKKEDHFEQSFQDIPLLRNDTRKLEEIAQTAKRRVKKIEIKSDIQKKESLKKKIGVLGLILLAFVWYYV